MSIPCGVDTIYNLHILQMLLAPEGIFIGEKWTTALPSKIDVDFFKVWQTFPVLNYLWIVYFAYILHLQKDRQSKPAEHHNVKAWFDLFWTHLIRNSFKIHFYRIGRSELKK